jgi:hypothetical protein
MGLVGPVELLVLTFPGEHLAGSVVDVLSEVVTRGDVTILDLLFISRAADGTVRTRDLDDLDDGSDILALADLTATPNVLVSADDIALIESALTPGLSAAVVVYEHTWALNVARAVKDAGGEVGLHVRIPAETAITAMLASESQLPA